MQVTRLRVYPIKSFAGDDVGSATVEPWGLEGDRRWAVVDPTGEPITAREANGLLGLTAKIQTDGGLLLGDRDGDGDGDGDGDRDDGSGGGRLRVPVPMDAAPIAVGHSRQGTALPAGREAAAWLSDRLGREAQLVWQPDPTARAVNPKHGGLPGDHVSLADVGPLLLTSEASLAQLDLWAGETLDMLRFRPNVVIDGDEPFAEDAWPGVRLGDIDFRVAGMCDRCVMTTIDPVSLVRGKEPIRTLARHRKKDGKTFFGVWLVPLGGGSLAVGDDVTPR